jgi:hypothetical protein
MILLPVFRIIRAYLFFALELLLELPFLCVCWLSGGFLRLNPSQTSYLIISGAVSLNLGVSRYDLS